MSTPGTAPAADGVLATWRQAPRPVKAVIAGILVNRFGGFLQIFLVLYLTQRGFSTVQAGTALGALGAGAVLGTLGGGWLAAQIGCRLAVAASMSATALCTVAVLYVPGYPALLGMVAGVGAASQLYRPAAAEVVSRYTPVERQVLVFAMYRLATNLGTTAAPLLGAALVAISYPVLFWVEALAALSVVAIGLSLPHDRPAGVGPRAEAGPPAGAGPRASYRAVLADRRYLLFLLAILGFAAVYNQYLATLPLTVRDAGLPTTVYSVCVAVNAAVVIALELVVTRWVRHWSGRVAAAAGILLVGAGLSAYALPLQFAGLVVATLVWSIGEVIGSPTLTAYPAGAGPVALRSRYLGASQSMFGLGAAIGPPLGVAVWAAAGDRFWLLCGLVAALSAAAAWRSMSDSRVHVPAASEAVELLEDSRQK
ncbi:MFS transporter [Micromonospora sp. DT228]|uniref:MFS transporter n=1 Tax=Micromonospora sp. DT228 TaxID=3393443 RepID=UPI003CEA0C99